MGSGPATGSRARAGRAATLGGGLSYLNKELDAVTREDAAIPPRDLQEARAEVRDEVVSQVEAERNIENIPAPGTIKSAIALAGEFGVDVEILSDREMRTMASARAGGFYDYATKKIYLAEGTYRGGVIYNTLMHKLGRAIGWQTSSHRDMVVHHELGHALHHRNLEQRGGVPLSSSKGRLTGGNSRFLQLHTRYMSKRLKKMITKEVSRYASTDRLEVVAEMYAGMRAGKTYSSRLMKYYKALGGPSVSS
jgi:hypothetical protein